MTTIPNLPQAGETITHQQAAFFAHLAGMAAKDLAERSGANPAAASALLDASRQMAQPQITDHSTLITPHLSALTVGILWSLEKLAQLTHDAALDDLDDLAISHLLFAEPESTDALIEAGDFATILHRGRALLRPMTIPQIREIQAHIAAEMSALTAQGKPSPAATPVPPVSQPSPATATAQQMAGPLPSSRSSSPTTELLSATPSGVGPSAPPSHFYPADRSDSATSQQA